jgi:small subunit ribosomal protein S20
MLPPLPHRTACPRPTPGHTDACPHAAVAGDLPSSPHDTRIAPVANIKSQIKRNRQNLKARERNKAVRTRTRSTVRRFEEAVAAGDKEAATAAYRDASAALDKAAGKNVIHANAAARRKSRLAKRLAAL